MYIENIVKKEEKLEQFLLFSIIFCYLLDFQVKAGLGGSLTGDQEVAG